MSVPVTALSLSTISDSCDDNAELSVTGEVDALVPGRYLVVYTLSTATAFLLMQLAPSPFLDWWWD